MNCNDLQDQRRVLVVDDEPDLVDLVSLNLQRRGYLPIGATNGLEGLNAARAERPDLAIVDVMMPEMDGLELVRRLRADPATADIPVLMLTARATEADELRGLGVGADDYVTKPFSMKVLLARVASLLRRAPEGAGAAEDTLRLGEVQVDLRTHEALVHGRPVALTRTEFRILAALLGARGRVLSRQSLIERAIGVGVQVTRRTIDVHVTSLRRKLADQADLVRTVRGVGYRAATDDASEAEENGPGVGGPVEQEA